MEGAGCPLRSLDMSLVDGMMVSLITHYEQAHGTVQRVYVDTVYAYIWMCVYTSTEASIRR